MRNVSKSLGANVLSSILASSKYPIGISPTGMTIHARPANDREHDTGKINATSFRYYDDGDVGTSGLDEWGRIISAIQSHLNVATACTERAPHPTPQNPEFTAAEWIARG